MPVYQYRGSACDHEFEVHQSFSDDPITVCPVCGKPVHRVIHASPVVFKGSGWYVTDSRPTSDPVGGVQDVAKMHDAAPATSTPEAKPAAAPSAAPPPAAASPAE